MSTALSPYDLWRTACPEHEEAEDYAVVVERFLDSFDHAEQVDQVLELLADLDRDARDAGLDNDFACAARRVADVVSHLYPNFKRTDRLCDRGKRGAR